MMLPYQKNGPAQVFFRIFFRFFFAFFSCKCARLGYSSRMKLNLLSVGADAKTSKGEAFGWLTAILYLAPARQAGRGEVCTHRSVGCTLACLYTAGRGKMSNVQQARIPCFSQLATNARMSANRSALKVAKSSKNNCVRRMRACCTLDILPRPAVYRHASVQPTDRCVQTSPRPA